MTRRRSRAARGLAARLLLAAASAAILFPFLWMILASFKTSDEIVRIPPALFPERFRWDNYLEIGKYFPMARFLATMMIPVQVTVIPLFLIVQRIGLQDSYAGLILPSLFSAFGVFLLRQHMLGIPDAFLEAAYMDGAGYLRVFAFVMLPLSVPVMVT